MLSVTIIPHTFRNTTLGGYRPGARVNLECDVLAKHVEKLLRRLDLKEALTVEKLREQGLLSLRLRLCGQVHSEPCACRRET